MTAVRFRPHPSAPSTYTALAECADYALTEEAWAWRLTVTPLGEGAGALSVDVPCREVGERMAPLLERHLAEGVLTRRALVWARRGAIDAENAERRAGGRVPWLVR